MGAQAQLQVCGWKGEETPEATPTIEDFHKTKNRYGLGPGAGFRKSVSATYIWVSGTASGS